MAGPLGLEVSTSAMSTGGLRAGGGLKYHQSFSGEQVVTSTGKQTRWVKTKPFQLEGFRGNGTALAGARALSPMNARVGPKFAVAMSAGIGSWVRWTTRRSMKHRSVLWCATGDGAGKRSPVSIHVLENEETSEGEKTAEVERELSRGQLLWRAAKPPLYSVAIVPLSVGAAVAFWTTGVFHAARYWLMFWSSILIITWLNLSNDAYDSLTGVDKNKRESVVNITGSLKGVLGAAYGCLCVGFGGLVVGASRAGDTRVAILLAAAIGCGYVYQCPPFRLSYKGLGEPLCFFAFGPLATTAFYLSQVQHIGTAMPQLTATVFGVSVIVGVTTALILFCSHFHQIEGDTLAGKMSPLVRIGTENGSKVVQAAVFGLYGWAAILTAVRSLPLACSALLLLTLPIGNLMLDFIKNNHSNKEAIFMAKYYAVRLHVSFGIALLLGFYLSARLHLPANW